jgi:hypothetical protein
VQPRKTKRALPPLGKVQRTKSGKFFFPLENNIDAPEERVLPPDKRDTRDPQTVATQLAALREIRPDVPLHELADQIDEAEIPSGVVASWVPPSKEAEVT